MKRYLRRLAFALALTATLTGVVLFTGCESLRGGGRKKPPVLVVPVELTLPGTMVVYMPKIVSGAKQQSGDPIYSNWANALMDYVDESSFVQSIVDQGRLLNSSTNISSKTIPSSDYSILLVGTQGRAVHVQEPWQSAKLFLLLDPYLRGNGSPKNLPPGCEAVRVTTRELKAETEKPAASDSTTPAPESQPPRATGEKTQPSGS